MQNKILFLNTYQDKGGAAKAAWNIFILLLENNFSVKHLSLFGKDIKQTNNSRSLYKFNSIYYLIHLLKRSVIELYLKIRYPKKLKIKYSVSFSFGIQKIIKHTWYSEADYIYLHWIEDGFIGFKELNKLFSSNKKIIWFLHDMEPFTGGCHHSLSCNRFKQKCGNCIVLGSNKKDLSSKISIKKQNIFKKRNDIKIIGASDWIIMKVKQSYLFRSYQTTKIPLFVNTNIFKQKDRHEIRNKFNFKVNKKYLCFGSIKSNKNVLKGGQLFLKALIKLSKTINMKNIIIVLFGSSKYDTKYDKICEIINLGYINNNKQMSELLNAVDVFISPSLAETFGQIVLESMLCGTPVIGFRNTALENLIIHKKTGYLSKYENVDDLVNGIIYVLNNLTRIKYKNNNIDKKYILNEYNKIFL